MVYPALVSCTRTKSSTRIAKNDSFSSCIEKDFHIYIYIFIRSPGLTTRRLSILLVICEVEEKAGDAFARVARYGMIAGTVRPNYFITRS